MTEDVAISARKLGKTYRIWDRPSSRLFSPAFEMIAGLLPRSSKIAQRINSRARRHYRDFHALDDVSFELKRGSALGIVGRNGSGKSTLLQILAGTLQPTSGSFETNGRIAALLELGSGFNPEFTGRENVFLNAALYGLSKKDTEARMDAIIAFADIGEFMDDPVKTYSSGMALRLAFAVIAHVEADILIVDEALAVGDVFFAQRCMRWLAEFRKQGSLLFVTHQAADLTSLCDSAIWLHNGRIQRKGEAKQVSEDYLAFFNQQEAGVSHHSTRTRSEPVPPGDGITESECEKRLVEKSRAASNSDVSAFEFDLEASGFGTGRATITGVRFTDQSGTVISSFNGGEIVQLIVAAEAHEDLENVILGFYLKNRLGQYLFGENTFLHTQDNPVSVRKGSVIEATFRFRIPLLPKGSYVVTPAIASGSLDNHAQHHWIHEALAIESHQAYVHRGLVGIPMHAVSCVATERNKTCDVEST